MASLLLLVLSSWLSFIAAALELVEEVEEVVEFRGNKGMINILPVLIRFTVRSAATSEIPSKDVTIIIIIVVVVVGVV